MEERLLAQLQRCDTVVDPADDLTNVERIIGREIDFMRSTGQRGKALSSLYQAIKSVPPTSEAQRAFSASGSLMTKVRSRLSDSTLSKLCLLRYYFKNS